MRILFLVCLLLTSQIFAKTGKLASTDGVLYLVNYNFGLNHQEVSWAKLTASDQASPREAWIQKFEQSLSDDLLKSGLYLKNIRKNKMDIFLEARFKKVRLTNEEAQQLAAQFGSRLVMWGQVSEVQDKIHIDVEIYEMPEFKRIQKIQLVEKINNSISEALVKSIEWPKKVVPKET